MQVADNIEYYVKEEGDSLKLLISLDLNARCGPSKSNERNTMVASTRGNIPIIYQDQELHAQGHLGQKCPYIMSVNCYVKAPPPLEGIPEYLAAALEHGSLEDIDVPELLFALIEALQTNQMQRLVRALWSNAPQD